MSDANCLNSVHGHRQGLLDLIWSGLPGRDASRESLGPLCVSSACLSRVEAIVDPGHEKEKKQVHRRTAVQDYEARCG